MKNRKLILLFVAINLIFICTNAAQHILPTSSIYYLPVEMWLKTFTYLKNDERLSFIGKLRSVNLRFYSFFNNDKKIQKLIIDTYENYSSPLHEAILDGQIWVIKSLIERRKTKEEQIEFLNAKNKDSKFTYTPLIYASCKRDRPAVVTFLLDTKESLEGTLSLKDNSELFEWAVNTGKIKNAKMLFRRGVNLHKHDERNESILSGSVFWAHYPVIEFLLKKGAHVDARDIEGETPLHVAVKKFHSKTVKVLLDHGATVLIKNAEGYTPLDMVSDEDACPCGVTLQVSQLCDPFGKEEKEIKDLLELYKQPLLPGTSNQAIMILLRNIHCQDRIQIVSRLTQLSKTCKGFISRNPYIQKWLNKAKNNI